MRYPLIIYHYEINKFLFKEVFPKSFDIRKPEPPIEEKYIENDWLNFILDGLVILGIIFTIAGIVGVTDGTKGSFGGILIGLAVTFVFYSIGANRRKEKEEIEAKNKQKKKGYEQDMLNYNKAAREYDILKAIEERPLMNLAYRNKLVLDFLDKSSSNRKQIKISFEKAPDLNILNDFRSKLRTKFASIASVSEIKNKDGSSYIPLLCLNILNSNINIIVDIDKPHLKYSSSEDLDTLIYSDIDLWHVFDDQYDDYVQRKFHESLREQNADLVKSGYIIIKFTTDQIVKNIDKSIATILKVLIYLNIYDAKAIASNFYYNEIDLSLSYEFEKNIFNFS